jgi:hypothetical protein
MKKILLFILGATLLSFTSCFQIDNWDEPNCTWSGTVTDSLTNMPLSSSQNDWQIRIWERSFTGHEGGATNFQELRIKQDGTYQNTKLFAGTYDMLPYNGPFWPMDTIRGLVLDKNFKYDFKVTPYLQIVDFSVELYKDGSDNWIRFRFKAKAPALTKDGRTLARLWRVRAFLSYTTYCGAGKDSSIDLSDYTDNKNIDMIDSGDIVDKDNNGIVTKKYAQATLNDNGNTNWTALIAAGPGNNTTKEICLNAKVKPEYTYYLRVGAAVNDTYQKYCYSDIKSLSVPK